MRWENGGIRLRFDVDSSGKFQRTTRFCSRDFFLAKFARENPTFSRFSSTRRHSYALHLLLCYCTDIRISRTISWFSLSRAGAANFAREATQITRTRIFANFLKNHFERIFAFNEKKKGDSIFLRTRASLHRYIRYDIT